jgi:hypothetical protein
VSLRVAVAAVGVAAVVVVASALTGLSLGRTALLAPVLVVGLAAVLGLIVFWGRVARQHLREARHPRVVVGVAVAAVGLLVALTLLGVDLPHE